MIELTSRGDNRVRYYNPAKIVSVGSYIIRKMVPEANGFGQRYADTDEGGTQVNYILLQGADEVDQVLETNEEVLFLMKVWNDRTSHVGWSSAHAVALGHNFAKGGQTFLFRTMT